MIKLSEGKIQKLVNDYNNFIKEANHDEELVFQIYDTTRNLKTQHKFLQLSLSDGKYYSDNIFIVKPSESMTLNKFNILKIKVKNFKSSSPESQMLAIKEFVLASDNEVSIIGNPMKLMKQIINEKNIHRNEDVGIGFADLNSFLNDIRLTARVIYKSKVKEYVNAQKKESKVFKVLLCDKKGDELCISLYNNSIDKYFEFFTPGDLIEIQNPDIKVNDKFRPLNSPDYTIFFNPSKTGVTRINDNSSIPQFGTANVINLEDIGSKQPNDLVDILFMVVKNFPPKQLNNGKYMKKLSICSQNKSSCELSFFEDSSSNVEEIEELLERNIILGKNLKVHDYNGFRSLQANNNTVLLTKNLETVFSKEIDILKKIQPNDKFNYIRGENSNQPNQAIAQSMSIQEMVDSFSKLSSADNKATNLYKIRGRIQLFKINLDSIMYPACIGCKKKSYEQEKDQYACQNTECEMNKKSQLFEPDWTYKLRFNILDCTAFENVDAFGDIVNRIVGFSAKELRDKSQEQIDDILNMNYSKEYIFRIRAKTEIYNNILKIKYNLVSFLENEDDAKNEEVVLALNHLISLK